MKINYESKASEHSDKVLFSLKTAVSNALDKKKKLGQYFIVWDEKVSIPKQLNYINEPNTEYQPPVI
ncbi:MAG: hypothetical protein COA86_03810 [Kangiella sp.]|nr:MAG: hypothetical protein COA86_05000 [Kangiella sp.]PHS19887.1 MAG: hypothetical protein COA86_03810 [Kangiella sp.]